MVKNILVLGDGLLGSEIINQSNWDYISRSKDNFDVKNFKSFKSKLSNYNIILNCIAFTKTYSLDENLHKEINYEFVKELTNYCNEEKKKLIHISTDYVYANSKNTRSENDECVPDENWYAKTKLMADEHIISNSNNFLLLRLSHKPYPFPYEFAWNDVFTSADYTPIISKHVINLIKKDCFGVYNVGTQRKSIFELAKKSNPDVKPISAPNNIPKDVSMNLNKFNNIYRDEVSFN